MSITINVSVDELIRFADDISNFSKYIDGDCAELEASLTQLAATMDDESVAQITYSAKQISKILMDQGPVLDNLEEKVREYAESVRRIKAILNK